MLVEIYSERLVRLEIGARQTEVARTGFVVDIQEAEQFGNRQVHGAVVVQAGHINIAHSLVAEREQYLLGGFALGERR